MPTTRPAPERTYKVYNWIVNELENDNGYEFITPQGYIFGFASKGDLLKWVADISWGGQKHNTMYGDIHEISADRVICVWKNDPWINSDWNHMDRICGVNHFIDVAMAYVEAHWI